MERTAAACFDKALAIIPGYIEAWYNRGLAMDDLGRFEEAVARYDIILQLNPTIYAQNLFLKAIRC